jgi:nitrile hydratase
MNGIHDMGGLTCFGPVESEPDEPVFHHEWERRVFALSVVMGGLFGPIDRRRYLLEILDPVFYLQSSYNERWFARFEQATREAGIVSEEEIHGGAVRPAPEGLPKPRSAEEVRHVLRAGIPVTRDVAGREPRFSRGDRVRTRNFQPAGHTRLPRYARGREGVIERCHGMHVFPDSNAAGDGEQPQPLYTVCFAATELWGDGASARDRLYLDLWEDYLLPATEGR